MINTKEINELVYAMHEPINILAMPPIMRWFRIASRETVVECHCPICDNSMYAIRTRSYWTHQSVRCYGTKFSQCPYCGQPIDWSDITERPYV